MNKWNKVVLPAVVLTAVLAAGVVSCPPMQNSPTERLTKACILAVLTYPE